MPIFNTQLGRVNVDNPQEALKSMANHIRYIQEQLEYTLMNLDSSNVTEIDTDQTNITSTTGGVNFTGNSMTLKGSRGETFEAGVVDNVFQFRLNGRSGEQIFYLTSNGEFVIPNKATVIVDGGTW